MIYKLHTSKATQEIFAKIGPNIGLQPFAMSKLAIALSIRQGKLSKDDFQNDNTGLELSRQTIFGDHDVIFKCLIVNEERRKITEEEYFPRIVKAHIDRGAKLLSNEVRYSKNLFMSLCELDNNL